MPANISRPYLNYHQAMKEIVKGDFPSREALIK